MGFLKTKRYGSKTWPTVAAAPQKIWMPGEKQVSRYSKLMYGIATHWIISIKIFWVWWIHGSIKINKTVTNFSSLLRGWLSLFGWCSATLSLSLSLSFRFTTIITALYFEPCVHCFPEGIVLSTIRANKHFVRVSTELARQTLSYLHFPVLRTTDSLKNFVLPQLAIEEQTDHWQTRNNIAETNWSEFRWFFTMFVTFLYECKLVCWTWEGCSGDIQCNLLDPINCNSKRW